MSRANTDLRSETEKELDRKYYRDMLQLLRDKIKSKQRGIKQAETELWEAKKEYARLKELLRRDGEHE